MPWSIPNATTTNTAAGTTLMVVNHPGSGVYSFPCVSFLVLATSALTTGHSTTGSWTRIYNGQASGSHSVSVWESISTDNGASATVSWTTSSNATALWAEFEYSSAGVQNTIFRTANSWTTTASGTSHATPSIIIPRDGSLKLVVFTTNDTAAAGSWSAGGGFTENVDFGAANYPRMALYYNLAGVKSTSNSLTGTSGVSTTGKVGIANYIGTNPSLVLKKYNRTRPIYTKKTRRA